MLRTLTAAAVVAAAVAAPALADTVDCPDIPATGSLPAGSQCASIPFGLDDAGMPRDAVEIATNRVAINPSGGEAGVADLTFTYIRDDGDYRFCFGFCDERDIDAGLLDRVMNEVADDDDRFAFAEACILGANSVKVFADMDKAEPEDVEPVVVPDYVVPANPVYFLIPNAMASDFMGAADRRAWWNTQEDMPLFSLSGANPENRDQLVLFTAEDRTAFFWEDITRKDGRGSDQDFGDLVFSVDAVLDAAVGGDCPAGCESESLTYTEGVTASVTSTTGTCASICFTC